MIAGHAPLAFAIAASVAAGLGVDDRRALQFGLIAGGFAIVPDVDMAYALVGLIGSVPTGIWDATAAFWASSSVVHRAATHSLVVAVPAALGFALLAGDRRRRAIGGALLVGVVAVELWIANPLDAAMVALYAAGGWLVARAARRVGIGVETTFALAVVGLVTHPFGDLFTGTPPNFLYPVAGPILTERIVLHPDPTLNLLAVFGLELGAIWLAVGVAAACLGRSIGRYLDRRAALGAGYGAVAVVLPAPTLDVSYHFVFSVLAVGAVGVVPLTDRLDRHRVAVAALTGLAAVTLGGAAYAVVYLLTFL